MLVFILQEEVFRFGAWTRSGTSVVPEQELVKKAMVSRLVSMDIITEVKE